MKFFSPMSVLPRLRRTNQLAALYSLFLIGCCALLSGCGATIGPGLPSPVVWVSQFGAASLSPSVETLGYGNEAATAIASDASGNVIVGGYVSGTFTGFSGHIPGEIDGFVTKYGPDGKQIFLQQFPGLLLGSIITSVDTDAAKNIFTVGGVVASTSSSYILLSKFNPNGKRMWVKVLTEFTGLTFGQQVKVESDGSVIVAGVQFNEAARSEELVGLRISADGNTVLWRKFTTLPAFGLLTSMTLDPSGNALVSGIFTISLLNQQTYAYIGKVDGATGALTWLKEVQTSEGSLVPLCMTTDPAGNVLVGGGAMQNIVSVGYGALATEKAVLTKVSGTDGSQIWQHTYATGAGEKVTGIQIAASGTIYAVGYTNGHFNTYDTQADEEIYILTLKKDGTAEEAHQFGSGPLAGTSVAYGPITTMDTSGNVFVTGPTTNAYKGFTNPNHLLQMFVAKLTPYDPQA